MAELLFGLIFVGALTLYGSMSWGWVIFKFWGWFILPVFTTLPAITFWQAVGLYFFISLFKTNNFGHAKDEEKSTGEIMFNHALAPWIVLVIGWLFNILLINP